MPLPKGAAAEGVVPVPTIIIDIGQNGDAVGLLVGGGGIERAGGDPLGIEPGAAVQFAGEALPAIVP
jgi:hypothetical protein